MTKILSLKDSSVEAVAMEVLANIFEQNIVALPVGGVMALACNAFSPEATGRMRQLRANSTFLPFAVLIADKEQLAGFCEPYSPEVADLLERHTPGALTIILKTLEHLPWDLGETGQTVQVSIPSDPLLQAILPQSGPLAVCLAAPYGKGKPTSVNQVQAAFGFFENEDVPGIACLVDGGRLDGEVSTILDATGDELKVVRQGRVRLK